MPWRTLITFILIFLILFFFVLNIDNRADVSFAVIQFESVPVVLSLFIAYVLGFLTALPFGIGKNVKLHIERWRHKRLENNQNRKERHAVQQEKKALKESKKQEKSNEKAKKRDKKADNVNNESETSSNELNK